MPLLPKEAQSQKIKNINNKLRKYKNDEKEVIQKRQQRQKKINRKNVVDKLIIFIARCQKNHQNEFARIMEKAEIKKNKIEEFETCGEKCVIDFVESMCSAVEKSLFGRRQREIGTTIECVTIMDLSQRLAKTSGVIVKDDLSSSIESDYQATQARLHLTMPVSEVLDGLECLLDEL